MRASITFAFAFLLFGCSSMSDARYAKTPREHYISNFNYFWDMKSDRGLSVYLTPFYGTFSPREIWRYDECVMEPECSPERDHSWAGANSFYMEPYKPSELRNVKFDYVYVGICTFFPFSPLENRASPAMYASADEKKIEEVINRREARLSEGVFTDQYLRYIDADQILRSEVNSIGLLSKDINTVLRRAWLQGRLQRPAAVYVLDGCGDGEIVVKFSFKEPTKRLQLISDFDYKLCKLSDLDPWDADQCPQVRDSLGREASLAGSYRVRITRETGEIVHREFEVGFRDATLRPELRF